MWQLRAGHVSARANASLSKQYVRAHAGRACMRRASIIRIRIEATTYICARTSEHFLDTVDIFVSPVVDLHLGFYNLDIS